MFPRLSLITESTPSQASGAEFGEAMSALASGVVLVTCRLDGRPWGMTVTALASVSADPPTVLVSLHSASRGGRAVAATRSFGVSILAADQVAVARFGASPGAAKFLDRLAEPGDTVGASPRVAGAVAHLDCAVVEAVEVADHTVYFGRVLDARSWHPGAPLVYHRRGYRTLTEDSPTDWRKRCLAN
jgi:flavin reductase (DIM6/NTAB) family NADH-FMN oxidoreductase RutF